MNTDAIRRALREYNAAQNSLRRAHAELREALQPGLTVLHKVPGSDDLFWSYEAGVVEGRGLIFEGVDSSNDMPRQCVIVDAPPPREEFLPRLEQ